MRFDVVTLFPEIFSAVRDCGITARARMRGLWSMNCWNPRDTATDLHRTIDDRPEFCPEWGAPDGCACT